MMYNREYLEYIANNIISILNDTDFKRYKKQLIAWKLEVMFNRDYDEDFLYNQILYLSTKSCILLQQEYKIELAINALIESAEILEYFGEISEKYDKEYCILLSSLCNDISGYQANATTLIKKLENYSFIEEGVDISLDNYVLEHIQLILLKNIFKARNKINTSLEEYDIGIKMFNHAMSSFYEHILNGTNTNFLDKLTDTYRYYLNSFNQYISFLLILLKTRLILFTKRSLWNNVYIEENPILKKYIKLLAYDYYDKNQVKNEDKRLSIFELWTSQLRAIENGLISKEKNFVVQMPTSAGKTFIAELSILNSLIKNPDKKCIYVAPFRALTTEKEIELKKYLSKLGYNISSLSGNYELDDFQNLIIEEADVLVATPEKIDLLMRITPEYFNNVSLIVIDEGHIIGDISPRASLLEFLVARLRIKVESLKILFISAVMPIENANDYSIWLNNDSESVLRSLKFPDSPANEEWEPTRKLFGKHIWTGQSGNKKGNIEFNIQNGTTGEQSTSFVNSVIRQKRYGRKTFPKNNDYEVTTALAHKLSSKGNTLIFTAKVDQTLQLGNAFLTYFELVDNIQEPIYFRISEDRESYYYAKMWLGEEHIITKCIKQGIGIHHGRLPEQVRTSVENDFRNNKLRVLIATNTIGQGLNFPIKNLIIHSTLYYVDQETYEDIGISVRDFWNIVGRTGRAGKETEGTVVFMIKINSRQDLDRFDKYFNKNKIEDAVSLITKVLLNYNSTKKDIFYNNIRVLSEVFLLDLLEADIEKQELLFDKLINNSLFKVQSEKKDLNLLPIKKSFKKISRDIKNNIDLELAKVYGQTGLIIHSNQVIDNYINGNSELIKRLIEQDNYQDFLELLLKLFDTNEIEEVKIKDCNFPHLYYKNIILQWIEGKDILTIRASWLNIETEIDILFTYISDGLTYRYPWVISSFFTILNHKFNLTHNDYPENLKNLVNYVKSGVNKESACFAKSMGIKNRDLCLILNEMSGEKKGLEFVKWISNLDENDINSFELNDFDKRNLVDVIFNLTPNSKLSFLNTFEFYIKGTGLNETYSINSLNINFESILQIQRDIDNNYDSFAIKVIDANENQLGFIPRDFSFILSPEIDINETQYSVSIIDIIHKTTFSLIKIKIEKVII